MNPGFRGHGVMGRMPCESNESECDGVSAGNMRNGVNERVRCMQTQTATLAISMTEGRGEPSVGEEFEISVF